MQQVAISGWEFEEKKTETGGVLFPMRTVFLKLFNLDEFLKELHKRKSRFL